MNKIKVGDEVIIISGKDKRKQGKVLKLAHDFCLVEGCNLIKKHQKSTAQSKGGIIETEGKIHVSNIGLYDPSTKRASRVHIVKLNDGRKVRRFVKSGNDVDS